MQLRTKVKTALAGLAIAGGAAAAVLIGPAGPALGFFSPPLLLEIHVASATLMAKGAAVDVSVQIQCAGARGNAFVDLSLTERAGGGDIASGFASADVKCTDQTVNLIVTAQNQAFKAGSAFADAFIFACAPRFCASERDQRTIKITH